MEEKKQRVIELLKSRNIEQRGHKIQVFEDEIGITNMDVPSRMDCRMIAEEVGVTFYVDESFALGVFQFDWDEEEDWEEEEDEEYED